MKFSEAISACFSKYATFKGRARRSEYWFFYLFQIIVSGGLSILSIGTSLIKLSSYELGTILDLLVSIVSMLFSLAIFLPTLAVTVRRLHDIGKSGWTYLFFCIPVIILLFSALMMAVALGVSIGSGFDGEMTGFIAITVIFFLLSMVASLVCGIVLIVMLCRDSQPGENKWGPNPKGVEANCSLEQID